MKSEALFCEGDLHATLEAQLDRVQGVVDGIPKQQFLNASDEALAEHVVAELHVEPMEVHQDRRSMDAHEAAVAPSSFYSDPFERGRAGVPGTKVVVEVPFTGDATLLKLRPSSYSSMFPRADVTTGRDGKAGSLQFVVDQPPGVPPEQVKQQIDRNLALLNSYVSSQRGQVEAYNLALPSRAQRAVLTRRARLLDQERLVAVLGIPLKQKETAPAVLPMRRKLVRPLPAAPKEGFVAEPGISENDYQHILNVIRHEGRTFETTPKTYLKLDEEELRDILLAHLNGHYEGDATGETFRSKGKTDIRIEDQNRCAFVGECKVWSGEKGLREGLDQLLGYLTWRDCKAALVVFNKTVAGFSELIEKLPNVIATSQGCRSAPVAVDAGEWRCRFASKDDASREIVLHVFLFNLFSDRKDK